MLCFLCTLIQTFYKTKLYWSCAKSIKIRLTWYKKKKRERRKSEFILGLFQAYVHFFFFSFLFQHQMLSFHSLFFLYSWANGGSCCFFLLFFVFQLCMRMCNGENQALSGRQRHQQAMWGEVKTVDEEKKMSRVKQRKQSCFCTSIVSLNHFWLMSKKRENMRGERAR